MSVADADIRNLNHETPVNVITMRSAMPAILALAAASTSDPHHAFDFRGCSDSSPTADTGADGAGISATAVNGATCSNAGIVLDGVNDYLNVDPWEFGGESMTVEAYVKYDAFNNWARIFDFGDGQYDDNVFLAYYQSTGKPSFGVLIGSSQKRLDSSSSFAANTWEHIVATVDGTTMKIYLNGALIATKTDGQEPASLTRAQHWIGRSHWSADDYLDGTIAYLRFWDGVALGADQVEQLHADTLTSSCSDVLALDTAAPDGKYLMYWNKDSYAPIDIYCHNMSSGSPQEQIELRNYGSADDDADDATELDDDAPLGWNYASRHVSSGCWADGSSRIYYQRLNVVDMATLEVDGDSITSVRVDDSPDCSGINHIPWSYASSCESSSTGTAIARIDLMYTSFIIDTERSTFGCDGWPNNGYIGSNGVVYSINGRRAIITGGAYCGNCYLSSTFLKPCDPNVDLLCGRTLPPTAAPTASSHLSWRGLRRGRE